MFSRVSASIFYEYGPPAARIFRMHVRPARKSRMFCGIPENAYAKNIGKHIGNGGREGRGGQESESRGGRRRAEESREGRRIAEEGRTGQRGGRGEREGRVTATNKGKLSRIFF